MNKAQITSSLVECLIESQFPQWSGLAVTAVELDGWDNTTFRLGNELSVRLPSDDGYVPQIEKEHRWLPVLAPQLPLSIPIALAKGVPGCGYSRPWSVYRWLEGAPASVDRVVDMSEFALTLANFLAVLFSIDSSEGPPAGAHSFYRGGPLSTYDSETRATIALLEDELDVSAATRVWENALEAKWEGRPVWVHGDVTPSNLLVVDGRLSAVIDFGCMATGDPACDTAIAWTFFSGLSREAFMRELRLDEETWTRGRGWALWKALITRNEERRLNAVGQDRASRRFGWRLDSGGIITDLLAS